MLISFSVTNYKSFRDETTLTMEATADKRMPENNALLFDGKIPVNKVSLIYGANASGKTTIMEALYSFKSMISTWKDDLPRLPYSPFVFDEHSKEKPTRMVAVVEIEDIKYQYGYTYNDTGIITEFLYSYPKKKKVTIFERNDEEFVFKKDLHFRKENARRVNRKSLYLTIASQFNDKDCRVVYKWFMEKFRVIISDNHHGREPIDELISSMEKDPSLRECVEKSFKIADMGITSIRNNLNENKDKNSNEVFRHLYMPRMILIKHEYKDNINELSIDEESSGTRRFLSIIGPIIRTLLNGGTIVVDEIDMSFHTDLCEWIVGLFIDPSENKHNSQLILNTHNVGLMDQDKIRRDQFWLTEKNWETGVSTIERLSNYGIRNDLDIRKAYLNGSFGSKPYISPDKLMGDD